MGNGQCCRQTAKSPQQYNAVKVLQKIPSLQYVKPKSPESITDLEQIINTHQEEIINQMILISTTDKKGDLDLKTNQTVAVYKDDHHELNRNKNCSLSVPQEEFMKTTSQVSKLATQNSQVSSGNPSINTIKFAVECFSSLSDNQDSDDGISRTPYSLLDFKKTKPKKMKSFDPRVHELKVEEVLSKYRRCENKKLSRFSNAKRSRDSQH